MDELNLYQKFNKLVELIPIESLLENPELVEYLSQIRDQLRPKDPKGGAPKQNYFNGRITVFQVDDVYRRLRELGIRDKQLAFKIVAHHYFQASPYALKRYYDHWKREEISQQTQAFLNQNRWPDSYFQMLLDKVQN
jgi:hypothetical protein